MSYTRTTWQNSTTPLSAANMNNIEDGIEEAIAASSAVDAKLYPVGSIHVTDQNVNPGTALGGTWSLISKRFSNTSDTSGFTFNSSNTQDGAVTWVRKEKSIALRLSWKNKVAYGESELTIGTFSVSTFGLTGTPYAQYVLGSSDGLDAILILYLSYSSSTGTLKLVDTIYKSTAPTTTGATCNATIDLLFSEAHMADAGCNQFVWRRTA